MSLRNLAKHVQKHGRGEDTMLIHMTPNEVGGLQRLAVAHGGSLTINPKTGLPEAGFLADILPMIAGAALAPFTGGLSAALIAGAGSGLYRGLKKGSVAEGIKGAITGGLGAYGGHGLASGLGALGAGAGQAAAGQAARAGATGAARAGMTGAAEGAGTWGLNAGSRLAANPAVAGIAEGTALQPALGAGSIPGSTLARGIQPFSPAGMAAYTPPVAPPITYEGMGAGFNRALSDPKAFVNAMGGGMKTAGHAGAAMTPFIAGAGEQPGLSPSMAGQQLSPAVRTRLASGYYQTPLYSGAPVDVVYNRGFAGGGRVDGMSDSVPAMLPNGQAARLSHDEFVIPADVVSGIGNGSTEAGANRLYEMLQQVRQARTGTPSAPLAIDPRYFMPR